MLAGIVVAATLSAIMSTADSQLLVAASAISYDVSSQKSRQNLVLSRLTVIAMCGIAMCLAIFAPEDIFTRVLFAWNALGAAFGPVVIIILMGRIISGKFTFLAIFIGFFSTVIFSFFPAPPGDVIERILPFVFAFIVAWFGSNKENSKVTAK